MESTALKNRLFHSINGILAIVFGLIAILFPSITLIVLAAYFAISIIIGGIFLIIAGIKAGKVRPGWSPQLFEGGIGILLGIIILFNPKISIAIFVAIVGIWAMLLGIFFLYIYFRRKLPGFERNFMLIVGIISLLLGILIAANPFESSRFVVVLVGLYTIAYGLFSIINTRRFYR